MILMKVSTCGAMGAEPVTITLKIQENMQQSHINIYVLDIFKNLALMHSYTHLSILIRHLLDSIKANHPSDLGKHEPIPKSLERLSRLEIF